MAHQFAAAIACIGQAARAMPPSRPFARRSRPGGLARTASAIMLLALLFQLLILVGPMAPAPGQPATLSGGAAFFDAAAICTSTPKAVADLPPATGERPPAGEHGFFCTDCHFCCQPPLLLTALTLPEPLKTRYRRLETVQLVAPCDPPRRTARARAPPALS